MYEVNKADWAAFLLRVGLGALLLAHAGLKVFVFSVPGTVQYFQSIGYPGFFAYLVILGEAGAGVFLLAGLYTRLMSLLMVPILIGALIEHAGNGWVFNSPSGGWEFPAFWTLALVVQAILGDGKFSLGEYLAERGVRLPLAARV